MSNHTGQSIDVFKGAEDNFKAMTALVVDGVDNIRSTVATMLTEAGFKKVLQAVNGAEAITIMSKHQVDLIISEWQIAKVDGLELLRRVRLDPKTSKIPFVMTSATIEQNDVIRAIKNGVSEYVVKPFSAKILVERLKRAIDNPIKHTASFIKKNKKDGEQEKEKLKVLVVDDVPDNIQIISDLLKRDYQVKAATNGELALKLCASKHQPDLVLLDIMMPKMDGLEVCKRLKASSKTQHIAIIFLTALDQTEDIVKGLDLGAVDYITKPINAPILKARVKTHSKVIEAQKQMRDQVDTLMEMARLKEEFDRVVKSDLRYPLTEITQSLELMERSFRDPNRVKHSASAIKASTMQLIQMVDNMLTLGKIEEGTYQLKPVSLDLQAIVATVVHTFETSISRKRLEIHNEVHESHLVDIEELLTLSLLSNLFKNAIEAAPRGSAVRIACKTENNFVVAEIHNMGEIPEEIQPRFFEKYVTCGKKDGTGIGTYAAKLMAEIQHGSISFKTSEKSGTSLFVKLPSA